MWKRNYVKGCENLYGTFITRIIRYILICFTNKNLQNLKWNKIHACGTVNSIMEESVQRWWNVEIMNRPPVILDWLPPTSTIQRMLLKEQGGRRMKHRPEFHIPKHWLSTINTWTVLTYLINWRGHIQTDRKSSCDLSSCILQVPVW